MPFVNRIRAVDTAWRATGGDVAEQFDCECPPGSVEHDRIVSHTLRRIDRDKFYLQTAVWETSKRAVSPAFVNDTFSMTLAEFVEAASKAEAHTRQRMLGQLEGAYRAIIAAAPKTFPDGSPDVGLCPLCDGSGLWDSHVCQACAGTGKSNLD